MAKKMNTIEKLIAELCPEGVEYCKLKEVTLHTANIKWSDVDGEEFRYIDLTSVDRITHTITETQAITNENAPSRAKQIVREGDVIFGTTRPMLKRYTLIPAEYDGNICSTGYCVLRPNKDRVLPNFIFHLLGIESFYTHVEANERGASYPAITDSAVKAFLIPIPPLAIQQEIVKILDTFTTLEAELEAELKARKKQYEYFRDELLTFGEDVEWKTLGEVATNLDSKRKPVTKSIRQAGEFPYYGASGIVDYVGDYIFDGDYLLVSEDGANLLARVTPIAFSASGKIWVNNHAHVLEFETYVERKFVEYYLNMIDLSRFISTAAQPKLTQDNLNKIPVPSPPLTEQQRIVAILDRFDALVNDISVGLPAELRARRKQYEYYRNKLLTFKPLEEDHAKQ